MIYNIDKQAMNFVKGLLLVCACLVLSACGNKEKVASNQPVQERFPDQQPVQQSAPPMAGYPTQYQYQPPPPPAPVYAPEPTYGYPARETPTSPDNRMQGYNLSPAPVYAPEPTYGYPARETPTSPDNRMQGYNPWSGSSQVKPSETQSAWRYRESSGQSINPYQQSISGRYRPLDTPNVTSDNSAISAYPATGNVPAPYAGGYTAYGYGGWPGYGGVGPYGGGYGPGYGGWPGGGYGPGYGGWPGGGYGQRFPGFGFPFGGW